MNEELLNRLDVLAAKLGVTAEMLWAALVNGNRIEGGVQLVLSGAILLGLLAVAWWLRKPGREWIADDTINAIPVGGACALLLVLAISCVCWIHEGIVQVVAPEYLAAQTILGMLQ